MPAPHALYSKMLAERTASRNVLVLFYLSIYILFHRIYQLHSHWKTCFTSMKPLGCKETSSRTFAVIRHGKMARAGPGPRKLLYFYSGVYCDILSRPAVTSLVSTYTNNPGRATAHVRCGDEGNMKIGRATTLLGVYWVGSWVQGLGIRVKCVGVQGRGFRVLGTKAEDSVQCTTGF